MLTLYLRLFIAYFKIGLFNFGGGYAMLPLIQHEIIEKNAWISNTEFADIIAISQMTPGPIGINCATYVGYQSARNMLLAQGMADSLWAYVQCMIGSFMATFAVCLPSFILLMLIARMLFKYAQNLHVKDLFAGLRPAVVGLMLASALMLMDSSNFGYATDERIKGVVICVAVFFLSWKYKVSPITLMVLSGVAGLFLYC